MNELPADLSESTQKRESHCIKAYATGVCPMFALGLQFGISDHLIARVRLFVGAGASRQAQIGRGIVAQVLEKDQEDDDLKIQMCKDQVSATHPIHPSPPLSRHHLTSP